MSASALVCLAPGSEETEAVTTIDLLVRGGIKVTTASVARDGSLAITCSRGVKILASFRAYHRGNLCSRRYGAGSARHFPHRQYDRLPWSEGYNSGRQVGG